MTNPTPPLTKERVLAVRAEFFNALVQQWTRSPERIDQIMGQSECFVPADDPETGGVEVFDAENGLLVRSVTPPNQGDEPYRFLYSILHAGDWLHFGILFQGSPQWLQAFDLQHREELAEDRIWDRPADQLTRDGGGILLEWRFVEPDFYSNYAVRERFIQIARHLHFRLCKVLRT